MLVVQLGQLDVFKRDMRLLAVVQGDFLGHFRVMEFYEGPSKDIISYISLPVTYEGPA